MLIYERRLVCYIFAFTIELVECMNELRHLGVNSMEKKYCVTYACRDLKEEYI